VLRALQDQVQIGRRFGPQGLADNSLCDLTSAPFSIAVGDNTGIGMGEDRINYNGGTLKTGSRTIQTNPTTGVKFIQYWNAAAADTILTTPAYGSHGNTARDQFRGLGYYDVDAALAKNTIQRSIRWKDHLLRTGQTNPGGPGRLLPGPLGNGARALRS
jgi:hypothetical protein